MKKFIDTLGRAGLVLLWFLLVIPIIAHFCDVYAEFYQDLFF